MPKITIDGTEVECQEGESVLQASLTAGWDVPHFCFHPALSVTASCRLCLMEMKVPRPGSGEFTWSLNLIPSCQTTVKDGMEIAFDTERVREARKRAMEFLLLNHPLDCPVCDQAGECCLQDYSQQFGDATGRMVDSKNTKPKKDIGSRTYLYSDRCVNCTRCVRFCEEVAGTSELGIVNRGSAAEIDVFPGEPLENPLQGNVVDICPVGAMLDKDFLMSQRVWFLERAESICPGCSSGCAITVDHSKGRIRRIKPRFNPGVNDWWMCDEGRFGWKYVHDVSRLTRVVLNGEGGEGGKGVEGDKDQTPDWAELPDIVRGRLKGIVEAEGAASVGVLLSPFMSCEEAWLLAKSVRQIASDATLALAPSATLGVDRVFPNGEGKSPLFTIRAEKSPNRRGVETVLEGMGGAVVGFSDFVEKTANGAFHAVWIVGGSPGDGGIAELSEFVNGLKSVDFVIVQDIRASVLTDAGDLVIPSCAWVERAGSFMNCDGKIQPFEAAISPPDGCQPDGRFLFALMGEEGLYSPARVRKMMADEMKAFEKLHVPPEKAGHGH